MRSSSCMLFVLRSCLGEGPESSWLVTDSRFFASTALAVWYSSEKRLILSAKNTARSRFLIIKSVAVNHLCSKHSSIDGRFLKENSLRMRQHELIECILQRSALKDEHKESRSLGCHFTVEIFESESAEADVGLRFILVTSSEWTCAWQHNIS